jgi:hypothetical protein
MQAALFLLVWAIGVAAFWVGVWRLSRSWQSLGLGLARALLRSFAVSLALAPTAIAAGLVGFPCPASAAIIAYAIDGQWGNREIKENLDTAFICFFAFWLFAFLIAAFRFLWIYDRRKTQTGA